MPKTCGYRNSLTLCLFTESAGTDILVSSLGNDLFTSTTSTKKLEVVDVQVFSKNRLLSQLINFFLCASGAFNVEQELTDPFGNVNTFAIAKTADCFLWIIQAFLLVSVWGKRSVTSRRLMLQCFLTYCILFSNVQCTVFFKINSNLQANLLFA